MSKNTTRDKTIQTRVSLEELAIIEKKAAFLGLAVSNYLRLIALHAKVEIYIQPVQTNQ